jgi:cytoskeletal protein RodZ
MTQQNLRELAKQGDPKVIASVINRTLQPKGITAQVGRDNDFLQVMLESEEVPNQYALMDFLRKGLMNLGIESIQAVKVYGRQAGEDLPAWEDEIELMPANPMFYGDEGEMPKKPIDDDDDLEPENYHREEEYNLDEDEDEDKDEDEDEHELEDDEEHELEDDEDETSSPKKQIPKVAMIGGGVLVLLLAAIAGLFFTGNLPFVSSSAPESPTPSPVPSSKGASPKPKSVASSPNSKATNAPKTASPSTVAAKPSPVVASPPTVAAKPSPVVASPPTVAAKPSPVVASPKPKPAPAKPDSWREAVNKAQNAANLAQTSISKGEWEEVASEWEKAVQLMKAVPPSSPNYQKAQQKAEEYQSNMDIAQRRAELTGQ